MGDAQYLLHQRVLDAAGRFPHRLAVLDASAIAAPCNSTDSALAMQPRCWTYAELAMQARRIAGCLPTPQCAVDAPLVALLGDKTCWSIGAILGALCAGYGYVAIVGLETAPAIEAALDSIRPQAVVTTATPPVLRKATCALRYKPRAVLDLHGDLPASAFSGVPRVYLGSMIEPRSVPPESIAYVVFTSGSTGKPRGVAVSHRAANAAVRMFEEHVQPSRSERVCGQVALGFDVSVFDIFATLGTGGTLVLASIDDAEHDNPIEHFRSTLAEHRITSLFTVPSVARDIFDDRFPRIQGLSLRRILLTGEPLDNCLAQKLLAQLPAGGALWNLYGASEFPYALARQVKRDDTRPPNAFDRVGRGVSLSLAPVRQTEDSARSAADAAGRPEPLSAVANSFGDHGDQARAPSELVVGGPATLSGYLDAGRRTTVIGTTGFRTGDLVTRDSDGLWHLLGRIDRTVKIAGVRANLDAIEAHLENHPDVGAAAVVLAPDGSKATAVVASSVTNRAMLEQQLDRHCRELLSPWICPGRYRIVATLPRTANGKKDRPRIMEMFI